MKNLLEEKNNHLKTIRDELKNISD